MFRVEGLGFRVQVSEINVKVSGVGLKVWKILRLVVRLYGPECQSSGLRA